jgi:hypothetical protein
VGTDAASHSFLHPYLVLYQFRFGWARVASRNLPDEHSVNCGDLPLHPDALRARGFVADVPPLWVIAYPRFFGANSVVRNELSVDEVRHLILELVYGVIANTVPLPAAPPAEVVP